MNARIAPELVRPHAAESIKSAPKHGASAFDHALSQVAPKKHEAPTQQSAPRQKQEQQRQPQQQDDKKQPADAAQDDLRRARLLAALHGIPLTALVVPRTVPATGASALEAEPAMAIEGAAPSVPQDAVATNPDDEPTPTPEAVDDRVGHGFDVSDELATSEEPTEETFVDPPASSSQPDIDPAQVAQLIASTRVTEPPKSEETPHDATADVVALQGVTRTNVAEPTRAVEAAAPVRDVHFHDLAETIANGSIEGTRARVVIGNGDDRIVLTVATHAHRVQLDVETNTPAGQQLAEQLRGGASDLRQALQRHGLDLADQRSSHQEAEQDEPPLQLDTKKPATPTVARPTGVVA